MIQRLKEEGVKHVNKVATEILPNRTSSSSKDTNKTRIQTGRGKS